MSNRASNRAAREAAAAQDARDYRFSCTALKITGGVGAVATLVSLWLTIRVLTEGQMATLTRFVPVMVVIASVYIVGLCVRRYRALTASGHVRGWREDMPDGPRTILSYSLMLLGVIVVPRDSKTLAGIPKLPERNDDTGEADQAHAARVS